MATTNKGLKADTTRHTFEIKKEHLKVIQALSLYNHLTRLEALTQLIDKGLEAIDKKTLTKALTLLAETKSNKKQSIFD